jgi:HK97 family phage prohead protease
MSNAPRVSLETARTLSEVRRVTSNLHIKQVRARVTKSPTDGSGRFVALVSTFGPPPDDGGDIISPGAYDGTITRAKVEHPRELWPVWWQHGYQDPANSIGIITDAATTSEGLLVEGRLDIDNSETAARVYEGLLDGRIREWSISFAVIREHDGEWDGKAAHFLDELELLEISSVVAGMNRFTRTLDVKAGFIVDADTPQTRLLRAAAEFAQAASRAQAYGLYEEEGVLMGESRVLRELVGQAQFTAVLTDVVKRVIREVRGVIGAIRRAGLPITADNLTRVVDDLALVTGKSHARDPEIAAFERELDEIVKSCRRGGQTQSLVDEFIEQDKAQLARERAEAQRKRELIQRVSLLPNYRIPSLADDRAKDAEEHARFVREMEERDAEKAAERERLDAVDAERREWVRNDPNTLTP